MSVESSADSVSDTPKEADNVAVAAGELKTSVPRELLFDLSDPVDLSEKVYQLWWHWADFHIHIISPVQKMLKPPRPIKPELLPQSNEYEFVYTIYDHGYKLSTSKEIVQSGSSMCKLYFTIEKMIFLLIEKLKAGGVATDTEVQIAFDGHELAQRKGFESVINLSYNVVISNFDPGTWGEHYLQVVKRIADKGFGYPLEAPRTPYRQPHQTPAVGTTR